MNATMLNTLLITTAVGTPAWMIWRKIKGRPFVARWLVTVGALLLPIILAKFFAPAAWMDIRTMPTLFWFLTGLPFLLGVSALGGGLIVFAVQLLGGFFDALDRSGWSTEEIDDSPSYNDLINPFDWQNDWNYEFYRNKD